MKPHGLDLGAITIMDMMRKVRSWLSDAGALDQKTIVGWLEEVYLPEYDFVLKAKIDTGAKNSSIHAMEVEYIKKAKGAGSRIRFKTTDMNGIPRVIEADVLKQVKIKRAGSFTETRPEIELGICLGEVRKRIRANLTDRAGMNYRMIVGRTALEGDFVVDVSKICCRVKRRKKMNRHFFSGGCLMIWK